MSLFRHRNQSCPILAALLTLSVNGAWAAERPVVHEIPFEFEARQILLAVSVQGQGPFQMILDTAVAPSVVDSSVAAAVDLATSGPGGFVAGFGSQRIPYQTAILESISLRTFSLVDLRTVVMDTSHLKIDGRQVFGALADSFFRRVWVQVDYPARTLRVVSNDQRSAEIPADCSAAGEELKADLSGAAPRLLDVRVDGQRITAVLDTGASSGLHLPLSEARRLGLGEKWDAAQPSEAIGARGGFEVRSTTVDSVRIGPFGATVVETVISPAAATALIGNGFLKDFVLTVDYHAGRLCLARSSAAGPADTP